MYIIIGFLLLIIFIQTFLLWKYQRQVKDICRQLAFLLKHDSNMPITRDIDFGSIGKLADLLNEYLASKRREHAQYRKKEKIISESTLQNIRNNGRITTDAIANLCNALDCQPGDIMEYVPDETQTDHD